LNEINELDAPFGIRDKSGAGFSLPNTTQTDAPINPGNSDRPLLPALKFCNAKRVH
jgi:S1-C subfamily serine protease